MHRYLFQVFSVNAWPDFTDRTVHKKRRALEAMDAHVLAIGSLIGTYARA